MRVPSRNLASSCSVSFVLTLKAHNSLVHFILRHLCSSIYAFHFTPSLQLYFTLRHICFTFSLYAPHLPSLLHFLARCVWSILLRLYLNVLTRHMRYSESSVEMLVQPESVVCIIAQYLFSKSGSADSNLGNIWSAHGISK
jgi:hypothetical protein